MILKVDFEKLNVLCFCWVKLHHFLNSLVHFTGGAAELRMTKHPLSFSFPPLAVRILQVLAVTGSPAVGSLASL